MSYHIKTQRKGFSHGYTPITTLEDKTHPTGIELGVLKLYAGESVVEAAELETAYLLMNGTVQVVIGSSRPQQWKRTSLFDEGPSCLHVGCGSTVSFIAESACELTVYKTKNSATFPPAVYLPQNVKNEHRGKGQVGNTAYRFVRTIFDKRNAHPNARLVLGEVITFPGKWSSYPPHHHAQPEIYHYRFDNEHGYGHGELGENVYLLRQYDTLKILDNLDHAQCAAPGYAMYYSWVIRHLPNDPYIAPTFTQEHDWTQEDGAPYWQPALKA